MRRKKKESKHIAAISYIDCPAKTFTEDNGSIRLGRNVFNHCQIVGYIARRLLERLPCSLQEHLFPVGSALVAASHDIGKVSPTFFLKLQRAVGSNYKSDYTFLERFYTCEESCWGGHAGVSSLTLKKEGCSKAVQTIAGQHHGFSPSVETYNADAEYFGGEAWQAERKALLKALEAEFGATWPDNLSDAQIRALSGLTSVADWIGSGSLFDLPDVPWQPNIDIALENAGYVPFQLRQGLTFTDIFGFTPREAQSKLIAACNKPGVYVLEAPMGLGKTEAALYCAYQMLESGNATGVYFALPTQLTSNKIYERFNQFLTTVLDENCFHRRALLLHGSAWLEETEMGEEGLPGNSWFHAGKRGLLAPFAVGTLDQALMAAMNVRHGFVRAFGLAGKVVILDEVHSYDAYTSVILDQLISLLKAMQCTVIILSATLSQTRRRELLATDVTSSDYPLITAVSNDVREISVTPPPERNVCIKLVGRDDLALEESLKRAEMGQQILWVENTVKDAQEKYLDFAARCQELGIACGLLHSRFTPEDRAKSEDKWVNALGKSGWQNRQQQGSIIVGTQVLEQSLDIDADFLVSRFAPTDMTLQRLGRLWRHSDTPRPVSSLCEAWLLTPDLESAISSPYTAFGASASVYNEYVLCRSLEAWIRQLNTSNSLSLPRDIRPLIDATYEEREEKGAMAKYRYQLLEGTSRRKGLKALRQLAIGTLSAAGQTLADTDAQTRYSEEGSGDILLLKSLKSDSDNRLTHLTLLNGETISVPWQKHRLSRQQWRALSRQLMCQVVSCRQSQLPMTLPRERCKQLGLGHVFYLGHPEFDENVPFAIALQGLAGELCGFELRLSDRFKYQYRQDTGLQISKVKE